jgi:phosphoribosylformylglycinamidine cyclo-ligase
MTTYAAAGVDLDAAARNVERIAGHVRSTHGPAVLGEFGRFAGLFHLRDLQDPVLVASTDGVGSKLLLGRQLGRYTTLGRDLVNLSVNDVITTGARPLFFLDYVAVGRLEPEVVEPLIAGMAAACRENGCAVLGGETAQLPELYPDGHFDLAGTIVGAVERDRIVDGSRVQAGDSVWGFPATGLHTNGYSLARRVVAEAGLDLDEDPDGRLGTTLGEALLAPHPSYWPRLEPLLASGQIKAVAHITGGGLPGNLPRVLPDGLGAELRWGTWPVPPVFDLLQRWGRIPFAEMRRVFNLGLGMVFVAAPSFEPGDTARRVGRITPAAAERVVLLDAPRDG